MFEIFVMIRHGDIVLPVPVYTDIADEQDAEDRQHELENDNPHNQFLHLDPELDG